MDSSLKLATERNGGLRPMKMILRTDIGQKRSNNQDYVNKFVNRGGQTLIVLADGMGGHRAGHVASEVTVTDLGREWVNTDFTEGDWEPIRTWLLETIQVENQKIYEMGQSEDYRGMGTTVEAVALVGNYAIFAHVGDSRVGLVREGAYHLLTSDHSLVNALVKAGHLTEEEAINHPQKNIITQSIGQSHDLEIDLAIQELFPGDYLVINSDGLTNMVATQVIEEVVMSDQSLEAKADQLINLANQAGGLDNITLALVQVGSEVASC